MEGNCILSLQLRGCDMIEENVVREERVPIEYTLDPEFEDLSELIEARGEHLNGLSNAVSLEVAHQKGLYPYGGKMKNADYNREKALLQTELLKVQHWVKATGQRIIVFCEGRDAAGKGGAIQRFMEHLDPRAAHVVALERPNEREKGQWYFQRYINHLPTQGEMVFFDRSWYNRPGVEKVMNFCSEEEYLKFLQQCPSLERMIVDSGIILVKYWFSVSRLEQLRRFYLRKTDPLKQWKLSPIDIQSLDKWDDYTKSKEKMFFHTDTMDAPWTVIKSDDKKRARIECLRHFLNHFDYPDKDPSVVISPDSQIAFATSSVYGKEE